MAINAEVPNRDCDDVGHREDITHDETAPIGKLAIKSGHCLCQQRLVQGTVILILNEKCSDSGMSMPLELFCGLADLYLDPPDPHVDQCHIDRCSAEQRRVRINRIQLPADRHRLRDCSAIIQH